MTSPWWRNFRETAMVKSEDYANRVIAAIGIAALIALGAGWFG